MRFRLVNDALVFNEVALNVSSHDSSPLSCTKNRRLGGSGRERRALVQCLQRYPLLYRLSAALVQFNHVAIRVAHEDSLRSGPEADRAAAQRDTRRLEPLLRGHDV